MQMPLMFELENRQVLIVGGGKIGARKAKTLLPYDPIITCVSKTFCDEFTNLNTVKCIKDSFHNKYLKNIDLVIAATDNNDINNEIYSYCNEEHILCMTVDRTNPSDFSFMATRKKEGLLLAVSTEGASPNFSKEMVTKLMDSISEEEFKRLEEMVRQRKLMIARKNQI